MSDEKDDSAIENSREKLMGVAVMNRSQESVRALREVAEQGRTARLAVMGAAARNRIECVRDYSIVGTTALGVVTGILPPRALGDNKVWKLAYAYAAYLLAAGLVLLALSVSANAIYQAVVL